MKRSIAKKVENIRKLSREEIAKLHNCKPSEVCMGDYIASYTDERCPYKVIMGFANFENSRCKNLGKLEVVYGKPMEEDVSADTNSEIHYWGLSIKFSDIEDTKNLTTVYGSIMLNDKVKSLKKIKYLGSNLYLNKTIVEDFGDCEVIKGRLNLEDMRGDLKSTKNLRKASVLYIDTLVLEELPNLESARILFGRKVSTKLKNYLNNNFIVDENGVFIRRELIDGQTV